MQLELLFMPKVPNRPDNHCLLVGARPVRLWFIRHRRARRYVLRLRPDGAARVTIPREGSIAEAKQFAEKNVGWLAKQLFRQAAQPMRPAIWLADTEILFRGEPVRLAVQTAESFCQICFANEIVPVRHPNGDLRPAVEQYLWRLAARELPARAHELAALHQFTVRRVTVRNQHSRWGSCSRRGTISLNWRLVQTPLFVRDYIVLHELAHLKEMNHSRGFWREVERLCPDFIQAERWLKKHSTVLL